MIDTFLVVKKLKARIKELKSHIYSQQTPIDNWVVLEDLTKEAKYPPNMNQARPFQKGDHWTGRDYYLWVETHLTLPTDPQDILVFDFGKSTEGATVGFESLLFIDDMPYQGVDTYHNEVFIEPHLAGKEVKLSVKLWSGLEGGGVKRERTHEFKQADIVTLESATEDLYYFSNMVLETIGELEDTNPLKYTLLDILNNTFKLLNWDQPIGSTFYQSVGLAKTYLEAKIAEVPKNELYQVGVIGHTHIDVAWLWRLKHTREKAARSFSTVLRYMTQYPEYTFLQTQPQIYQYIKEDYPEIYAQIKERVAEGRWEIDGAMWLEADCNIPSGESLTRQILHGSKFIKEEFGKEVNYLWLPDVFGYSWALPQILKKSGIDTFMTTKISWNQFNRMPNDTFNWKGIDGSEVLTHFITTPVVGENTDWAEDWYYTYNGGLTPKTVLGTYAGYRDKNINSDLLIAYGLGDGGGGVTREMLENRRKLDLIPGLPEIKPVLAKDYFEKLHTTVAETDQYVHTWDGELYLEYHRGTYTSQAFVKKSNRQTELALRDLEMIYATYEQTTAVKYPKEQLFGMWEVLLRNQFHDIIPGSSIEEVYGDLRNEFAQVWEMIATLTATPTQSEKPINLLNTAPWDRNTLIELPLSEPGSFYDEDNNLLKSITHGDSTTVFVENQPALTSRAISFYPTKKEDQQQVSILSEAGLETDFYRISWNESGHLTSIFDKKMHREVLTGTGNVLQLFEDKPIDYDAWDIDIFYQEKSEDLSFDHIQVVENNAIYTDVQLTCHFKHSSILQIMRVYNHTKRIDFRTTVDWGEHQQLLKVKFDVDIRATEARYDIQYGNVLRPTHWNTSWDMAKFETVGHQWADLSEKGYGVALLNDCKYGYDIKGSVMRLSLIKSGIHPDPMADIGSHEFVYSLFPHEGDFVEGNVVQEAWEINAPLVVTEMDATPIFSLTSNSRIMIDAYKKAEDGNGWILRFHDFTGGKQVVHFDLKEGFSWNEVNLMEKNCSIVNAGPLQTTLTPYEIKSYRLTKNS